MKIESPETGREVLISRILDAPRKLVFKAWTDPEQLVKWYAPKGCSIKFTRLEARQGGTFLSCIRIPDGKDCWCTGEYMEVSEPERLVFTMAVADEAGNRMDATDAGMDPDWPAETKVTVTFEDLEGKTKLTLYQTVSESLAIKTGAHPSWISMLDLLDELLTKQ